MDSPAGSHDTIFVSWAFSGLHHFKPTVPQSGTVATGRLERNGRGSLNTGLEHGTASVIAHQEPRIATSAVRATHSATGCCTTPSPVPIRSGHPLPEGEGWG
jgi:hypothetical protein